MIVDGYLDAILTRESLDVVPEFGFGFTGNIIHLEGFGHLEKASPIIRIAGRVDSGSHDADSPAGCLATQLLERSSIEIRSKDTVAKLASELVARESLDILDAELLTLVERLEESELVESIGLHGYLPSSLLGLRLGLQSSADSQKEAAEQKNLLEHRKSIG